MLNHLLIGLLSSFAVAGPLQIDIAPSGIDEATAKALEKMALESPRLKKRLQGLRYRILSTDFGEPEKHDKSDASNEGVARDSGSFEFKIYDYTNDRLITASARGPGARGEVELQETTDQPVPTPDEIAEAIEIISKDKRFAGKLKARRLVPYEAMPPTIDLRTSSEERLERVISVGLQPSSGKTRHEIVGVNLSRGSVVRFESGAPPTAIAAVDHCGYRNAGQYTTGRGTTGTATVRVSRDGQTLWNFSVTRPSASGGALGSGIDLKNIYYKGTKVLARAHIPILNVHYLNNVCGPYRDWQYSENAFVAYGTNIAAGIRRASSKPTTVFDTGNDYGNFRGVAIYDEGSETVLTTEISAAWYRYIVEYRFHEDGTLTPRMKFTGVYNSCVCRTHYHNVYWRFDFDIGSATPNAVEVFNGASWSRMTSEAKQYRSGTNRAWRVVNTATGDGYNITPGATDGAADSYARGDVWALKYYSTQIDDSRVRTSTAANLDAFVTGEPINGTDVVLWYAGHFTHDTADESVPHVVGPSLKPINWGN